MDDVTVNADTLLEAALATIEKEEGDEMTDDSVQETVYFALSEVLQEHLSYWLNTWVCDASDGRFWNDEDAPLLRKPEDQPDGPLDYVDLFVPLVGITWRGVNPYAVAEAILRMKGMWH